MPTGVACGAAPPRPPDHQFRDRPTRLVRHATATGRGASADLLGLKRPPRAGHRHGGARRRLGRWVRCAAESSWPRSARTARLLPVYLGFVTNWSVGAGWSEVSPTEADQDHQPVMASGDVARGEPLLPPHRCAAADRTTAPGLRQRLIAKQSPVPAWLTVNPPVGCFASTSGCTR